MKYRRIKTWYDRCNSHPDHQTGMVTYEMIQRRMQEEIDDLRKEITLLRRTVTKLEKQNAPIKSQV